MGDNCTGHIGNNTKGAYFTIQKELPFLNDGASIILNISVADEAGVINGTLYAATRAALRSFTRSIAAELVGRGIRVNAVSPARRIRACRIAQSSDGRISERHREQGPDKAHWATRNRKRRGLSRVVGRLVHHRCGNPRGRRIWADLDAARRRERDFPLQFRVSGRLALRGPPAAGRLMVNKMLALPWNSSFTVSLDSLLRSAG